MAPAPTPAHLAGPALDRPSTVPPAGLRLAALQPLRELSLPRPDEACSGLFPGLDVCPPPLARGGLRLRRAVLWTVVIGAMGLLGYVSWQYAAHARAATPVGELHPLPSPTSW